MDDSVHIKDTIEHLEKDGFKDSLDDIIDDVLLSGCLVFLFFYADWCHFCKLEKPIIDDLESVYSDRIVFLRLNGAKNPQAMKEFDVEGFPTMFLVYGRNGSSFLYRDFRGFRDKAFLVENIVKILGGESPSENEELNNQYHESIGGLFGHKSCDFTDCADKCTDEKERDLGDTVQELAEAITGCVDPSDITKIYSCGKALSTNNLDDWISCAVSLLAYIGEKAGMAGCVYSISNALADAFGAGEFGECLGECIYDPSSYGQECQPGETRSYCLDDSIFATKYCTSDCEWKLLPGSSGVCPMGSKCVETVAGATCKEEDICEIEPSLPQCRDRDPERPDDDGYGDGDGDGWRWRKNDSTWHKKSR